MVGTVQSGIANVYKNTQNIAAGNGFQSQAAQAEQQQRTERTQETEKNNRSNADEANLSAQKAADNELQVAAQSDARDQRPGSIVDITV